MAYSHLQRGSLPVGPQHGHIDSLSSEVLTSILDMVLQSTPPHELIKVSLVNKVWHRVAQRIRSHAVSLILTPEYITFSRLQLSGLRVAGNLKAVRRVRFLGIDPNEYDSRYSDKREAYREVVACFCTMLPLMTALREVSWSGSPVSAEILDAIASRSNIHLSVMLTHNEGQASPGEFAERQLTGLVANQNLHAFHLNATISSMPEWQAIQYSLKQVILSSSSLRELQLDIRLSAARRPSRRLNCNLGIGRKETLPALERLEVSPEYAFGAVWYHGDATADDIGPELANELEPKQGDDFCANKLNWGEIRTLSLRSQLEAMHWVSKMTSLTSVSFRLGNELESMDRDAPEDSEVDGSIDDGDYSDADSDSEKCFFEVLPSRLQKINLPWAASISQNGLTKHGPSLRSIIFHRGAADHGFYGDNAITISALNALRKLCPLLNRLELDLERDATENWPLSHLSELALFHRLDELVLWFDIRKRYPQHRRRLDPAEPTLKYKTMKTLLGSMLERKSQLQTLKVHCAAVPRPIVPIWPPPPKVDERWRSEQNITFECFRRTIPSSTAAFSIEGFQIDCTGLHRELNSCLPTGILPSKDPSPPSRPIPARPDDCELTTDEWNALKMDEKDRAKQEYIGCQRELFELALSGPTPIEKLP